MKRLAKLGGPVNSFLALYTNQGPSSESEVHRSAEGAKGVIVGPAGMGVCVAVGSGVTMVVASTVIVGVSAPAVAVIVPSWSLISLAKFRLGILQLTDARKRPRTTLARRNFFLYQLSSMGNPPELFLYNSPICHYVTQTKFIGCNTWMTILKYPITTWYLIAQ
jgi:hypothetical protein